MKPEPRIECYEVRFDGRAELVVTSDVDMACLQFSNVFGFPLQPEHFHPAPMPELFWGY